MGNLSRKALPVLAVLAVTAGLIVVLFATKPKPDMSPREEVAVPVRIMETSAESREITIVAHGTVIAARELSLSPEVSGKVAWINPDLAPGAYLPEGAEIVKLDDRDYQAAAKQARAQVTAAEANLRLEQGRQKVATSEWEYMKDTGLAQNADKDLALRRPQLKNLESALESARASRDVALLNLERTVLEAPFNVVVRTKSVEQGQLVGPQNMVAKLAGADVYWVQVSVPVAQLPFIRLPGDGGSAGARATVYMDAGQDAQVVRSGKVIQLLSDLEPSGRMARLLVEIDDPLGKKSQQPGLPLLLDAFVRVEIEGREISGVVAIPREALREDDTVWIMDGDGRLEIRRVHLVWRAEDDVLASRGIEPGERLVTSKLASPLPGTLLEVAPERKPERADER